MSKYNITLSEEQIISNYEKLISYVDLFSEDRKNKVYEMYNALANQIMIAPASAYKTHHAAYPGGYVAHTLNVITNAAKLYPLWKDSGSNTSKFTREEIVFSAMFHDLGKIGDVGVDYYVPETNDWWIENRGRLYISNNPKLQYMPHEDRSLYLLQKFGIEVTSTEYITIKTHNGPYVDSVDAYTKLHTEKHMDFRNSLPIILHHADIMATRIESEQEGLYDI